MQQVATVLTVYGIETEFIASGIKMPIDVATVLTVYGIETEYQSLWHLDLEFWVATVPTVYGMRRRVRGSRGATR